MNFVINLEVDWTIFILFFMNASIAAFPIGYVISSVLSWIKAGPSLD